MWIWITIGLVSVVYAFYTFLTTTRWMRRVLHYHDSEPGKRLKIVHGVIGWSVVPVALLLFPWTKFQEWRRERKVTRKEAVRRQESAKRASEFEKIFGYDPLRYYSTSSFLAQPWVDEELRRLAHRMQSAFALQEAMRNVGKDDNMIDVLAANVKKDFWHARGLANEFGRDVRPKYTDYLKAVASVAA